MADEGEQVRHAGFVYIIFALVFLGVQLAFRFMVCADPISCGISLAKAAVWAPIWPLYPYVLLPQTIQGLVILSAGAAIGCWIGWTLREPDVTE
jgi:hypothetical protein